ncbi:putative ankyrin repeat protein RF_0381 [Ischnura elegans]|uniref:putative ankyrin repeat protein RF_0381 n=1 Tax=Ischnura elegans TaxID=197161 RepID=UPI001ED89391|nr:putative ankyrin repeat protein RF_0381 [Ischnura elegans]
MPTECITNPLQRELADSIVRMAPLDDIRILLACGAKANGPVTQGLRPLHYAVWQHYAEAVKLLLTRGADVDARDDCGYSALHLAAEHGSGDLVALLIEHGATVNFPPPSPRPGRRLGGRQGGRSRLVDEDEGRRRDENGNDRVDGYEAPDANRDANEVAGEGEERERPEVSVYVEEKLFPRTELCDEPLRLAIKNGHLEVARMLLEAGADPNRRYFFGAEINLVPPMQVDVLHLLLTYGADPDTRDRAGLTPLMKAARLPQGIESVLLLISFGADVNACADERNDLRSVLHYAVLSGNVATVNLLLRQGAKPNFPSDYGYPTPMHLAVLRGDPEIVRLLLEAGADANVPARVIGTPLHVACADGIPHCAEILHLLLGVGKADPNLIVDSGDGGPNLRPVLAEYLASNENPCPIVLNLLMRYGARVVVKTQFRHPLGILNSLTHAPTQGPQILLLLEAAEGYDPLMIRRSPLLTPAQKSIILAMSSQPLSLRHQCRLAIRQYMGLSLPDKVHELPLPQILHRYLMYEIR